MTNGVIPVTRFPLRLKAVGTLWDFKVAVMEHEAVRGFLQRRHSRGIAEANVLHPGHFF